MKFVGEIIRNFKSKRITSQKIAEAYALRDSKYLRKAYRNSPRYRMRSILEYLGKISIQENFDFLLNELKANQNENIGIYIYIALLNVSQSSEIVIPINEIEYLDRISELYQYTDYYISRPSSGTKNDPLILRNRLGNYLRDLEEMKDRNRIQ